MPRRKNTVKDRAKNVQTTEAGVPARKTEQAESDDDYYFAVGDQPPPTMTFDERRGDGSRLFVLKTHRNLGYHSHFHDMIELYYIKSGEMSAIINGKKYSAQAGEILFSNSYVVHSYAESDADVVVLIVGTYYLSEYRKYFGDDGLPNHMPDRKVNAVIADAFDSLFKLYDGANELMKSAYVSYVLGWLANNYGTLEKSTKENLPRRILDYVHMNFNEPLTLPSVANEFFYSAMGFSRLVHRCFGLDFRMLVNNIRAEHMRYMLDDEANGNFTLLQIASRCGFDNMTSMYRAYKRVYGELPIKKRKRKR
jgi:AraC-like DNA-binding protein/mannose-6-phosphate isomerase-like protein (cupin superfamily)